MISCTVVGRLARDPELRMTPSGVPVAKFSLASNSRVGDKEVTTWIRCVAWRGAAEAITKYSRKGEMLSVSGPLRDNRWKNADDREVVTQELHVAEFGLLPNGRRTTGENTETQSDAPDAVQESFEDIP